MRRPLLHVGARRALGRRRLLSCVATRSHTSLLLFHGCGSDGGADDRACGRLLLVLSARLAAAGPDARSSRNAGVSSVPTRTPAGRAAFAAERSSRALTAARRRSSLSQIGPPALRAAFLRGALARERTRRRRARSCAHATPNAASNAGPRDPSVSSMGIPPMCAKGAPIIGRSRLCSRRLGGAPRGLAQDRRVGHGSRRRSRGRPPSRPRVSS
jgi:hypothetical protein